LALKQFILPLFFIAFAFVASGQQYLEFVENKGQWDAGIKFKGYLKTGSFSLKPDGGYKMTLLNHDDIATQAALIHGHKKETAIGGGDLGGDKDLTTFSTNTSLNNTNASDIVIRGHVYEVKFLNANPNPIAVPDKLQPNYNNYFLGNDKSKWAGGCKIFGAITYKNIYPNIDVRYYTDKGQLKYDIIVNPGGDISRVALYVDGVDELNLKDGQLIFKTSVDEVKEAIPYSYQAGIKGTKPVTCRFDVRGNIIRYKLDEPIDKAATLVIDPSLIFSTYTGSTAENWGYTATYDGAGNFYGGGIVFGASTPFNNGAFAFKGGGGSGEPGGLFDIGIIKFNPLGTTKIYATYLGGTGSDYPQSLVVDAADNLVVAGKSSASDYPGSTRAAGRSDLDIVLTKLKADGTGLIGSRMIGGTGNDGVNIQNKYPTDGQGVNSIRRNYGDDSRSEVIVDASGNLLLASCTQSLDFPLVNAFQTVNGGNNATGRAQDAVFIKTTSDLTTILVSSFLGGDNDDAAFVLAINPVNSNIYVAGGTVSTNFPGDKSNTVGSNYVGGECDGFVTILNSAGTQIIKSSYFGTSGADVIYGIQFDKNGFPYIMGTTTGNWPTTNNVAFRQAGGKQFIAKLQSNLSVYVYSTVFGTNSSVPNISPTAFLVDRCENVYVSGWGGSANSELRYPSAGTNGLSITPDAIKRTGDGNDFYFFVMARDATSQLYGSFFGQNGGYGEHVDGGTSRFDANGIIYQSLCSCDKPIDTNPANAFPISGGAFASARGTSATFCNLAAIKIAFNLAGVGAGVQSSVKGTANRKVGCVFTEIEFKDTLALGTSYKWNFGDGTPELTTTEPNIKHAYNVVGSYNVRLIAIDSSTCNITDTSYVTINVRSDAATLGLVVTKLACDNLNYRFDNISTPPTGKPFRSNSFNLFFGDASNQVIGVGSVQHSYAAEGTYNTGLVLIDTNYCNYNDTFKVQLRIAANVKAQFTTPATGCAPYTAIIKNTTLAGQDFNWDFGDGSTFFGANPPPHLYSNIGTYTIRLTVSDTNTCNKIDSTSFTITVSGKPTAAFTYNPQPPQANTAVIFTNNAIGATNYKWLYGDGDSLVTTNVNAIVSHIYNATNTYDACLIVNNNSGCFDTICQPINAIIIPLLDVPNAITPNGDGVNDKVLVRGYGITKMDWRIYNRWGVLVFSSNDQKIGWDGRYKGSIQALDVYTYTLNVEFSDGTKYSKKGDITLLR
jgi:gliding motility-associated-like protein